MENQIAENVIGKDGKTGQALMPSMMSTTTTMSTLHATVSALMTDRKGILAADESVGTAGKRLASIGMENTEENRRRMREWILGAGGLRDSVAGIILFDETLRQRERATGRSFVEVLRDADIVVGIKVDKGTTALRRADGGSSVAPRPETVTTGLDGLEDRLQGSVRRWIPPRTCTTNFHPHEQRLMVTAHAPP